MGPEKGTGVLIKQINGTKWDGAGVGFGVRGSNRPDVTVLFGGELSTVTYRLATNSTKTSSRCIVTHSQRPRLSSAIRPTAQFGQSVGNFQ